MEANLTPLQVVDLGNARLRAWRSLCPELHLNPPYGWAVGVDRIARLRLRCSMHGMNQLRWERLYRTSLCWIRNIEIHNARRLYEHLGCHHVSAVMFDEPSGFEELVQLELLAG